MYIIWVKRCARSLVAGYGGIVIELSLGRWLASSVYKAVNAARYFSLTDSQRSPQPERAHVCMLQAWALSEAGYWR